MIHENRNTASRLFQLPQVSGNVRATAMGLLACPVAFAAGYITTDIDQHALKVAAASRYFPRIYIFACSIIASLFTVLAAGRFPVFQQYCFAFFIILVSSSQSLISSSTVAHLRGWSTLLFTRIRNRAQLLWNPVAVAEIKMDTQEDGYHRGIV